MAINSTSFLRVSGLASGLDTDSIIKQLMDAERAPLDRLLQNKQLLEWRQDDYRTLNAKLLALRNASTNMKLRSSYSQYSTSSSNSSAVTATATSGATATTYTFNSITALAKSSNIKTADGQTISRDTSVVTGGAITDIIDTDVNNTFKISYDGGAFVDITLDPGKIYNGTTPGGTFSNLAADIQTKIDTALGAGKVMVSVTKDNYIQFIANEYPASGAPKTITLQEGAANDLLSESMNFNTNETTGQISSTVKDISLTETIYTNLMQHRFKNTEDFGWVVNGDYEETLAAAVDNITSDVAFNSENVSNYTVTAIETESQTLAAEASTVTTALNYNSTNWNNASVYVNGEEYTVVNGEQQSELADDEVSISDDGTGKIKLTFKSNLAIGDQVQIDSKINYSVVTGVTQEELTGMQVLVEDDGMGNAKFTFKNTMGIGTQINVDRHDFEFTTMVYDQDGEAVEKSFNVNAYSESFNSVMSRVSSTTSGLTAFYDTGTDKVVFNSRYTGNNISGDDITLTGNFLTSALMMTSYTEGNDASFSINGLATTRKTNTFVINGVTFNLTGTSATATDITISRNTNDIYETIKTFIDSYNETIEAINTKLTEDRDNDYKPLTDAQKEAMNESDIELWEGKARNGLLRSDSLLTRIVNTMRKSLYDQVTSVTDTSHDRLTDIGITTSSFYQSRGKLVIDEAKLKEALENNFDDVVTLFTNASTSTDNITKYEENGLMVRLYNNLVSGISDLTTKAGQDNSYSLFDSSLLGKEMTQLDRKISDWEDRLQDMEERYYSKFSALETAMDKMNSQSMWISSMFNNGAQ
jgi:flagellar hook-associated protein 2